MISRRGTQCPLASFFLHIPLHMLTNSSLSFPSHSGYSDTIIISQMSTMASHTLITPTTTSPKPLLPVIKSKLAIPTAASNTFCRREVTALAATILSSTILLRPATSWAADDDEYVKETSEVITKVKSTISLDRNDPNVADAVADLRESSNSWVAKYRREKALLGRVSFRDVYSALNAVSGHYISFGPTAPIPAKRRARILEEVETAEKALKRGR